MSYEEILYEGYGPGGVAVMLQVLTDNRNRTTAEIRHLFAKHGGNLGESGCVGFLFKKQGYLIVPKVGRRRGDRDGGGPRGRRRGLLRRRSGAVRDLHRTRCTCTGSRRPSSSAVSPIEQAKLEMVPATQVRLEDKRAEQMIRLMDAFEDHDDVQNVWANFDIDERILQAG